MIVHKEQLILHVDNPHVILNAIATAKSKLVNGKQLLVVPYQAEEIKVLKNLGLTVPPPKLQFNYTGRFKPFAHQKIATEFLILHRRGFNLSDPGTGKTAAALWAAEYLRQKGKLLRILITCPLSVVNVWEEESFNILPHRSFCRLLGTKAKRLDLLSKGSDICVINHDGLGTIVQELKAAKFDLIIADEASAYRNPGTKRYRQFRDLCRQTPWLWLLTGTPVTKAPTDAYGLVKLINPAAFPGGLTLWKEMTMTNVGKFKWIPKADSTEFVYKYMQPAIRFKKEDCIDLPELTYVNRHCELTEQQTKAFTLMKQKLIMEQANGEKISAANAAVKLLKLVQICCGVVKNNDGEHYILDASTRLKTLEECVEESGGKVIIFVPFLGVMDAVQKHLESKGWSTGLVNGAVSERARTKIFDEFQKGDLECLIAHPKTAAHGLNLTASSTVCWYGPTWSAEMYLQANSRINRAGQKQKMTIYHIVSTPLETSIFQALKQKVLMSDTILNQYQEIMK